MKMGLFSTEELEDFHRQVVAAGQPKQIQWVGILTEQIIEAELRKRKIVTAARQAHQEIWRSTGDESAGDKLAKSVEETWQTKLTELGFDKSVVIPEFPVSDGDRDRIDLYDSQTSTAYELKSSGKNSPHEFYKNCFKVLLAREYSKYLPRRFVFLTEKTGISRLQKSLGQKSLEFMNRQGVETQLLCLDEEAW